MLATIPFLRALAAGVPANWGDLGAFYYWECFLVEHLRSGHLPLWTPHAFCGYPFAADPQAQAMYPLNAILLLGPLRISITLFEIAHLWIAGLLQYCYLRSLRLKPLAGYFGAVCFMLGGHLMAAYYSQNVTRACVLAWVPGMLWATHMAVTRRSIPWAIAGVGFTSMCILAGYPQTTAYGLVLVAAQVTLSQMLAGKMRITALMRDYALLGIGLALCGGVVAAQALPAAEFLGLSVREAQTFERASAYSLAPYQLVTIALPYVLGSPVQQNNMLGTSFLEGCVYVGILPLMLILVPAGCPRLSAIRRAFLALAVLFVVLALGNHTPVYHLVYDYVPFIRSFRLPIRALSMVQFLLACLAGVGMASLQEHLHSDPSRLKWFLRVYVLGTAGMAAGLAGTIVLRSRVTALGEKLIRSQYAPDLIPEKLGKLAGLQLLQQQTMLFAMALLVVGLIAVLACRSRRLAVGPCLTVLLVLGIADLLAFGLPLLRAGDLLTRPSPRAYASALAPDRGSYRILPLFEDLFEKNSGHLNGYQNAQGYNSLVFRDFTMMTVRANGRPADGPLTSIPDIRRADSRVVDLLNVRYVLSIRPLDLPKLKLIQDRPYVYENLRAMPRVWLASDVQYASSNACALDVVSDQSFDPRARVVLVGQGTEPTSARSGDSGQAVVTAYSPDRITVDIDSTRDAYLVFSEIYCPGWHARVDGKPASVERADFALRAVKVSAGRHNVEMWYMPRSLRIGGIISLCSILVSVVLLAAAMRRKSKAA